MPQSEPALLTRLVHELQDVAIFLIDPDGRLRTWNPGVRRLLGYSEQEWIGQTSEMIFTEEDRAKDAPRRELETAISAGSCPDVRWHKRKDGSRLFVEGVMQAFHDEDGQLLGFAKLMKDATERQLVQETLTATLESITDAFYSVDAKYRFTYVNRKAEQLWGRSREDLLGREFWTEFPQAVKTQPYEMHLKVMADRQPVRFETVSPVIRRWIDVSIYPNPQGGLSCYFRDIDDKKRDEQRLAQLALALDQAQTMVRSFDGIIEFWSAGCERLYGFTRAEAVGRVSHELLRTEFTCQLEAMNSQLLEKGVWHGELCHHKRDGSSVAVESDWVLQQSAGPEGPFVIEANTDISEQKRAQRELRSANEELRYFSHIASHDLQAPLRMVKTSAQLLSRYLGPALDETAAAYVQQINDGADGMVTLIGSLLEYAHAAEHYPAKRSVALEAVLKSVLAVLKPAIEESGVEIKHDGLGTVSADPVQLQQVIQNIFGNAIKYRDPNRQPKIKLDVQKDSDDYVFRISDNGIGIPPQHHERIFEPMHRLHGPEISGTGIGLAVCKRIVERHGGRIWVESTPGCGSTFFFTLPIVR